MAGSEEVVDLFSLTINDGEVVSKVDAIIEVVKNLGVATDEAMAAVTDALDAGLLNFGEAQQAWQKLGESAVQGAQEIEGAAQIVKVAEEQITASFKGTVDELSILTTMFSSSSIDMPGLVQAGYDIEQVRAAIQTLIETADPAAAAMSLLSTNMDGFAASTLSAWEEMQKADESLLSMDNALVGLEEPLSGVNEQLLALQDGVLGLAAAFDTNVQAVMQETQVVSDYLSVLGEMNGAMEAATVGMGPLDQAIADATNIYAELDDQVPKVADDVQTLGNDAETAGAQVSTANDSFGASQYILMQLGFMAFSAASQFLTLGANIQDTMAIIQGKTGASDTQMQQWQDTLQQIGIKGGYSMEELWQALDIVTQAQYKGADATTVLQSAQELARASGSKLTDSTNLLAMAMVSYGAKASDAHTYAAILFDALSNGKQNIQELANALGPVMGEAAQAGIGFNDLVTAETDFSRSTGNSMVATRQFQGMIMALAGDSQLTHDQLIKLGLAFDDVKFQTLDFAGKLELLAKYTNGNVGQFIQLIGGMKNAKDAMATLDISTQQLSKNAENLGLSFDPVKYNAMDAGDKLYYLLQVSGYNEAEFKKLTTGGVNPLNDALSQLDLKTLDVANRAKQMGLNFDETRFQSESLKQKLWDLWDASGHNIDIFGKLIGGTKNVNGAFATMGTSADDTGKKQDNLGKKSDDLGNKHLAKNAPIQMHMKDLEDHLHGLNDNLDKSGGHLQTTTDKVKHLDDAYNKVSQDVKTSSGNFNSGWSALAQAFVTQVGPTLVPILDALGNAALWASKHLPDLWNGFLRLLGPLGVLAGDLNDIGPHVADIIFWLDKAYRDISKWVNDVIDEFSRLNYNLVGGSIVPDMINAINTAFLNAGPRWLGSITQDINSLLGAFGNLATQMYTSAGHAVDQFVAGLLSRLPNVADAANQIAQKIASFLHHSTPDIGPMAGDDQWMPDFVELMATGMEANISRLTLASSQVAQALIPPVGYSTSPFASQQSVAPIVAVLSQILAVLQSQRSGTQGGGVPPSVTLNNVFAGGSPNVNQINNQLDQLGGIRFEAGLRGGI